jgi:hypothetical protein
MCVQFSVLRREAKICYVLKFEGGSVAVVVSNPCHAASLVFIVFHGIDAAGLKINFYSEYYSYSVVFLLSSFGRRFQNKKDLVRPSYDSEAGLRRLNIPSFLFYAIKISQLQV